MTLFKVTEVIERSNKNGDPFWDIKAEDGGHVVSFRDHMPGVEWTVDHWYEVELGERQPIPDRPGMFYVAPVLLAKPAEPPAHQDRPAAGTSAGSGYYTPEQVEEFRRNHALNAAATVLSAWVGREEHLEPEELALTVVDIASRLLPFLRGKRASATDSEPIAPPAPSTATTPPATKPPQLVKATAEQVAEIKQLAAHLPGGLRGLLTEQQPHVLTTTGWNPGLLTWLQAETLLTILDDGSKADADAQLPFE